MAVNLIFRCCFTCVIIDFRRKGKQWISIPEEVGISWEGAKARLLPKNSNVAFNPFHRYQLARR